MVILELVGQGIKGIPAALRVSLNAGYTLFLAPQGGVSLWPLIDALCFPDPRAGGHAFLANPQASVARLGLTFQGRDGLTYRLVREIGGPGTLAKMDPATGKFIGVTKVAEELTQFLRSSLGVPTRGTFESVFTLNRGQFPSVQPARPATGATAAVTGPTRIPSGLMAAYNVQPVGDIGVAQKQLQELRAELVQVKELEDLQFRLDGAQRRIFESGGRVKAAEKLATELAAAKIAMESAPSLEALGLPPNVGERAARLDVAEKNRDDQLNKLDAERDQFLGSTRTLAPLYKDQGFLAATGIGILVVAVAFALGNAWRYLALLDMPAFGAAAIFALRWVTDLQVNEGVSRRKAHYDEREKQIRDAVETEMLSVRTAMKLLQVETVGDLMEVLGKRQVLDSQVRTIETQLRSLETDPAYAAAVEDSAAAQVEVMALESRINQLSSYSRSSTQIDSEIAQLENGIRAAQGAKPAGLDPSAQPTLQNGPVVAEDPMPRMLSSVTDLFSLDLPGLAQLLMPRAAQYITALSDRRLTAVELSWAGAATAMAGSGRVAFGSLPGPDRDMVYLAVKLALMEKAAERQKIPLIFDDPFAAFDPPRVQLLGRMLKHLGTKTHVLHVSQQAGTASQADTQLDLAVG